MRRFAPIPFGLAAALASMAFLAAAGRASGSDPTLPPPGPADPARAGSPVGAIPAASEPSQFNPFLPVPGWADLAPAGTAGVRASAAAEPSEVEPLFIRPLTSVKKGYNDSNPAWSASGDYLAFERSTKERKEIVIARSDGTILRSIYHQAGSRDFDAFLTGFLEEVSYNAGIAWSPQGDRFVFMSNGGTGNYDLFLGSIGSTEVVRLTDGEEKDGQADWSPVGDQIVFVSGRDGKADLFLMDLPTREVRKLTSGAGSYLYPQWSPDGRKVAVITGDNENHDVAVVENISSPIPSVRPVPTVHVLTRWTHDDLRPTWSPDGNRLAFYSNYNPAQDPKTWSLMVIAADGSDPAEGDGLAGKVRAANVVPDVERGPSWLPDGGRIVYVANDRVAFFPIRMVEVETGRDWRVDTGTRINHDVSCSRAGTIAFRAQVEQWDQMFLTRLEPLPVPPAPSTPASEPAAAPQTAKPEGGQR